MLCENGYFFYPGLLLQLQSVIYFYTTVINTNHALKPHMNSCICAEAERNGTSKDNNKSQRAVLTDITGKGITGFYTNMIRWLVFFFIYCEIGYEL